MAELLLADYLQMLTHRLLPFFIYVCVLQRSNLCFIKQICIFLSDCVFASLGKSSLRAPFPCVHNPIRAMPSSSLWREPALQARPGRGARCAAASSTGAAVQRYPHVSPKAHPPGQHSISWLRRQFNINGGSDHCTHGLNALPAKTRLFSALHETEQQKEKQQEPEHICAHAHACTHSPPPTLHPAVFNRLTATFWAPWTKVLKLALQVLLR